MEKCELLAKAQALAIKKGLDDSQVNCPFIKMGEVCTGEVCIYQADLDMKKQNDTRTH